MNGRPRSKATRTLGNSIPARQKLAHQFQHLKPHIIKSMSEIRDIFFGGGKSVSSVLFADCKSSLETQRDSSHHFSGRSWFLSKMGRNTKVFDAIIAEEGTSLRLFDT